MTVQDKAHLEYLYPGFLTGSCVSLQRTEWRHAWLFRLEYTFPVFVNPPATCHNESELARVDLPGFLGRN